MKLTADTHTFNFVEFNRMNKLVTKEVSRNNAKTILFTSCNDSEGKTFMGINLALNFTNNTPKRILLMDMNLRNPQFHNIFSVPKQNGVTDILNDNVPIEETIKKTDFPNLSIVTSGTYDGIKSQSFMDLQFVIEEARSSYDLVFIESSPIFISSKQNVDPAILSSLMDIVLLVVMARRTRKISLLRGNELVQLSGGEIFGVVMNNKFVPQKKKKKGVIRRK